MLSKSLYICRRSNYALSQSLNVTQRFYFHFDDMFTEEEEKTLKKIKYDISELPRATKVKGKFLSPWSNETHKSFSLARKWLLSRYQNQKEYAHLASIKDYILKPTEVNKKLIEKVDKPHFTWLGHASCYYQSDGVYILTDPVFSKRCSPSQWVGPHRLFEPPLRVDEMKIDVVLLSHTHYDHMDYHTCMQIGNKALWIVPLGVKDILESWGITNCVELDWWKSHEYKNVQFTFTPTKHWTSRNPFDRNTCLWGSYVVSCPSSNFFFTGDTSYCDVFKKIGEMHGPFDLAAIPIGAYKPRWAMKDVHVEPSESLKIHQDLNSKQSIAVHWGTFHLADEFAVEPALELGRCRAMTTITDKEFFSIHPGDTHIVKSEPYRDYANTHPEKLAKYIQALAKQTPV